MKISSRLFFVAVLFLLLYVHSCTKDPDNGPVNGDKDLTSISYNPLEYDIVVPPNFPPMPQPGDNIATIDGVELGRYLFYDPILSVDSTVSCATCHKQELYFTDGLALSEGVNGARGTRSSMSLVNVGYFDNGLLWDGRAKTLEEQVLDPVILPHEMNNTWEEVESRLRGHAYYPEMFRTAFGIKRASEINRDLVAKAIAQFERTIVSTGKSKWDKVRAPGSNFIFDDDELEGKMMFFDEVMELPDAECGHCHNGFLFATNQYFNNGIDTVDNLMGFPDYGRGLVTGDTLDNGKFRATSLRNVLYTAPFMHDGRFNSIEDVMKHYNSGGHNALNTDVNIHPLGLTEKQVEQVITFLMTLSDTSLLSVEKYSSPFK